jgi:hypothetical protein
MSMLSTCCSAPPDDRFDYSEGDCICSECGEHSEMYNDMEDE